MTTIVNLTRRKLDVGHYEIVDKRNGMVVGEVIRDSPSDDNPWTYYVAEDLWTAGRRGIGPAPTLTEGVRYIAALIRTS